MKLFNIIFFLVISILFSCQNSSAKKEKKPLINKKNQVEVIDFYGTHRCVTCKEMEANTKYTVDTYFSDEQKNGTVVFKTINVDEDKNAKIAENFEASGTALFLNVIKNGKETHINLTDLGFAKGRNKEAFSKELKSKIETELKNL